MTERPTDPRTIQQQEQQHAERNRAAVRRGLQHARHEDQHETPPKPLTQVRHPQRKNKRPGAASVLGNRKGRRAL